jgi:hypothetical protein
MLLFLEIMLTVTAWRKGYKAWALVPLGLALLIGFLIGLNNPELAESGDVLSLIWIDILAIVVLGIMIASAKKPEDKKVKEIEASGEPVTKQDGQRELATSQTESEFN